jgi:glycosyltransferase involved in cell wall biosynthesis
MSQAVKKKILILSGVDFKEISIQVIRKTPEAYVKAGWEVHYVVGRDNSKNGDYFYERVTNPEGVHVHRFSIPLAGLHGLWNHALWLALIFRIRNVFLVTMLAIRALSLQRKHDFTVIYGNEIYGVLAARMARFFGFSRKVKFVIRFYGVHMISWYRKKQLFRWITNIAAVVALKTKADMCIMTNDGTMGTFFLKMLNNKTPIVKFFVNGVEPRTLVSTELEETKQKYFNKPVTYFLSVCRLVPQKRVDRSVRLISAIVKQGYENLHYVMVGEGAENRNLIELVKSLDIEKYVTFVGPIPNKKVKYFLETGDVFLTMDNVSNVGNPLLEAIRYNQLIVTINTGETAEWIRHLENGLIFPLNGTDLTAENYNAMATDIIRVIKDKNLVSKLKENIRKTEVEKIWTWDERMAAEIAAVSELLT